MTTPVIHELTPLETLEAATACEHLNKSLERGDVVLEKVRETLIANLHAQVPIDEIDNAATLARGAR